MAGVVLVLNANFEPVHVCSIRRAMGMLLSDKAILVLNGRTQIHTVNRIYPGPSVIRLHHLIRRPRSEVRLTRCEIFRRDNYTCQYCGKQTNNLTVDHVVPRRLYGKHIWTNVVAACPSCNHLKGGRTLLEAGMRLAHQPTLPPNTAKFFFGRYLENNIDWEPFLTGW